MQNWKEQLKTLNVHPARTEVVNLHKIKKHEYDVYIGSRQASTGYTKHFGNPFTHLENIPGTIQVATREKAVEAFKDWVNDIKYHDLEPGRRKWILANLHTLKGKRLACYCKPFPCHGDVLAEMADKTLNHGE